MMGVWKSYLIKLYNILSPLYCLTSHDQQTDHVLFSHENAQTWDTRMAGNAPDLPQLRVLIVKDQIQPPHPLLQTRNDDTKSEKVAGWWQGCPPRLTPQPVVECSEFVIAPSCPYHVSSSRRGMQRLKYIPPKRFTARPHLLPSVVPLDQELPRRRVVVLHPARGPVRMLAVIVELGAGRGAPAVLHTPLHTDHSPVASLSFAVNQSPPEGGMPHAEQWFGPAPSQPTPPACRGPGPCCRSRPAGGNSTAPGPGRGGDGMGFGGTYAEPHTQTQGRARGG